MKTSSIVSTTGAQCQEIEGSARRRIAIDLELDIAYGGVQSDGHCSFFCSMTIAVISDVNRSNLKKEMQQKEVAICEADRMSDLRNNAFCCVLFLGFAITRRTMTTYRY